MCIFLLINRLQLCSEIKGFSLFFRVKSLCVWPYGLMDMYLFSPQLLIYIATALGRGRVGSPTLSRLYPRRSNLEQLGGV